MPKANPNLESTDEPASASRPSPKATATKSEDVNSVLDLLMDLMLNPVPKSDAENSEENQPKNGKEAIASRPKSSKSDAVVTDDEVLIPRKKSGQTQTKTVTDQSSQSNSNYQRTNPTAKTATNSNATVNQSQTTRKNASSANPSSPNASKNASKNPSQTRKSAKPSVDAKNTLVEIRQDGMRILPKDTEEIKLKDINATVEIEPPEWEIKVPEFKPFPKVGSNREKPVKEKTEISDDDDPQEDLANLGSLQDLFSLFKNNSPTNESETENDVVINEEIEPEQKEKIEGEKGGAIESINPPENQLTNSNSQSLASSKKANKSANNGGEDLEILQSILVGPELARFKELNIRLEEKLRKLDDQIHNPEELLNLILPLVADLLQMKVAEAREDVARAIAPIIDEVIARKTAEDRESMIDAISPIIADAIAKEIYANPQSVAKAIGPEISAAIREQNSIDEDSIAQALAPQMGKAIKEQIVLERDAMVDALYPVIGNTIAKYMKEAIQSINEKVSNTFSLQGMRRQVQAKVQGISPAELILKESMPLQLIAIFLIHKDSGLIIVDIQPENRPRLESEMIAGMLTAIRSFVNDCISQSGEVSELNQIEYGASQIILEVAGYCYLALLVEGAPTKKFLKKMRQIMGEIILRDGKAISAFTGDQSTIPITVNKKLEQLIRVAKEPDKPEKKDKPPLALLGLILVILGMIFVPWQMNQNRQAVNQQTIADVSQALAYNPELSIYQLDVLIEGETLQLKGRLPNQRLRQTAAQIARKAAPSWQLDNQVVTINVPPEPLLVEAEVKRVTGVLNKTPGISVQSKYQGGKVSIIGKVMDSGDAQKVVQAIEQIPGVNAVVSAIKLDPVKINNRIYFSSGSEKLDPNYDSLLRDIQKLLVQYPNVKLKLIGYSDRKGRPKRNLQLALKRAESVREALILRGVNPQRLTAESTLDLPPNTNPNEPSVLSRVVVFELMTDKK